MQLMIVIIKSVGKIPVKYYYYFFLSQRKQVSFVIPESKRVQFSIIENKEDFLKMLSTRAVWLVVRCLDVSAVGV